MVAVGIDDATLPIELSSLSPTVNQAEGDP